MDNNYTSFELISMNAALAERQVTELLIIYLIPQMFTTVPP